MGEYVLFGHILAPKNAVQTTRRRSAVIQRWACPCLAEAAVISMVMSRVVPRLSEPAYRVYPGKNGDFIGSLKVLCL